MGHSALDEDQSWEKDIVFERPTGVLSAQTHKDMFMKENETKVKDCRNIFGKSKAPSIEAIRWSTL